MGGAAAVLGELGPAVLAGAVLAIAVLALVPLCEARPAAGLVTLAGGLLTAAFDAAGAGVVASAPEVLLWAGGGLLFARAFEAPAAAFTIPLLVGALAAPGPRPELDAPVLGGDPLLLDLVATQVPAFVAAVLATLGAWARRLGLHPAWAPVLVVICAACVALELQPVTALCAGFFVLCLPDLLGRLRGGSG